MEKKIEYKSNAHFLMFITPDPDTKLLVRESQPFKKGEHKGKKMMYITVELEQDRELKSTADGKKREVHGRKGGKMPYNIWEHNWDAGIFESILSELEAANPNKDVYELTSDKRVEIMEGLMEGAFYAVPCRHVDLTGVERNRVRFFLPTHTNVIGAPEEQFDRERDLLVAEGRIIGDDDEAFEQLQQGKKALDEVEKPAAEPAPVTTRKQRNR